METANTNLPALENPGLGTSNEVQTGKIEDFRPGYPQYTALLAAYDPYTICRRFSRLRARLLLLKQDRLSMLEEKLEQLDQEERCPLFLGKSRCDRNLERISIVSEIESQLAEYETYQFADRSHRMLSLVPARRRDVESLQNWLDGNGCLAEEESAYLSHHRELVSLAPAGDSAITQLEIWVEDRLIQLWRNFRKGSFHNMSGDPNVYLYSGPWVQRIAKVLLLLLVTFLLLTPVVICNLISSISARILIVLVSTTLYLLVLLLLTKSRTIELILAGATYATILIVFISGTRVV